MYRHLGSSICAAGAMIKELACDHAGGVLTTLQTHLKQKEKSLRLDNVRLEKYIL